MSKIIFEEHALEDLKKWAKENPKILKRIVELMDSLWKDPFRGICKPEAFKHQYRCLWSRRITDEHRLIYKVDAEKIIIIYSLVNHYPLD